MESAGFLLVSQKSSGVNLPIRPVTGFALPSLHVTARSPLARVAGPRDVTSDPMVVSTPVTSTRSLMVTGIPSSS